MATVTKPIALNESINTTESPSRNIADVLAQELSGISNAITGGANKAPKTDIATVEPSNTASRAYSVDELVYVNGNLYKVITAISIGATFTVGTNIQSTNVSSGISSVIGQIPNIDLLAIDRLSIQFSAQYNLIAFEFYANTSDRYSLYFEVFSTGKITLYKNGVVVWQK